MSILTNTAAVYFEQEKFTECIAKCEQAIDVGRENRADFKLIAKVGRSFEVHVSVCLSVCHPRFIAMKMW